MGDDLFDFRVQQGLPAADDDGARAQVGKFVQAPEHDFRRHRSGKIVILVAVDAGEVAAPYGNDVGQDRMLCRQESLDYETELSVVGPEPGRSLHRELSDVRILNGIDNKNDN